MFLTKFKFSAISTFFITVAFVTAFMGSVTMADDDHKDDRKTIQTKPYIVIVGPTELMQVRVNLESYQPTAKEVKKIEVNFGDGFITVNKKDIYHTYLTNNKYSVIVKSWDSKNVLTTYTQVLDVNAKFIVKDILNAKVLGPVAFNGEKKIKLNLSAVEAARLYKVSLAKNSAVIGRKNKKCSREFEIAINGIDIFREEEINCHTTLIEKFVWLNTSNIISFDVHELKYKNLYTVEIKAVELTKDNADVIAPVLTTNAVSNSTVKNNLIHASVADASAVVTYVWDNNQNLLNTISGAAFDLALAEGRNDYVLQSVDASGNKSAYLYLTNIVLDTIPAVLSTNVLTQYIYSSYPQTVSVLINSNENLQMVTVNNQTAIMLAPNSFKFDILLNQPQTLNLNIKGFDIAGNETLVSLNPIFNIDNIPPNISASIASNAFTNVSTFSVTTTDNSNVSTEIFNNGVLVLTSNVNVFDVPLTLGVNNFVIKATDLYHNVSTVSLNNITYDMTAPLITTTTPSQLYYQSLPQNIVLSFSVDELLQGFSVNGQEVSGSGLQYSYNYTTAILGANSVSVKAIDLAGNISVKNISFNLNIDGIAPVLSIGAIPTVTKSNELLVSFNVVEANAVSTSISVNGLNVATVTEKIFTYLLPLPIEGVNTIEAVSTDAVGNVSNVVVAKVQRDSVGPQLISISPVANEVSTKIRFLVSGVTNEELSEVKINNVIVPLAADKKSFSYPCVASAVGSQLISIDLTDLIGNSSSLSIPVSIESPLLIQSLVTIQISPDGNTYTVVGLPNASREGAEISVSEGTLSFNRGTDIVKPDGSFSVPLNKFSKVTVKAFDPIIRDQSSFELLFNLPTTLTGIIKDSDDVPIFGATVRVLGSNVFAKSDAAGVFNINNVPIGDQVISVDGSTSVQSTSGVQKKYSITNVTFSISAGKVNTFGRPIYITSVLLDGTATSVASNQPTLVTNVNAPGVSISIPVNSAIFPDGTRSGLISMQEISADKSVLPLPASFQPDTIISLEPSGLKFTQPVELTLPNVNELKDGSEVFILSLNSISGQWEIDGVGKVLPGGQSIKTKPGYGIRHFSEIAVVPVIPLFESVQDPNLDGINTSAGSNELSISLPSYKSLGETLTPSLRYNASWANPTAFVSNIFDVPKYEVKFKDEINKYSSESLQGSPYFCIGSWCSTPQYRQEVYHLENYSFDSGYFVDSLSAQSWVGINATDDQNFESVNQPSAKGDLPGVTLKNSIKTVPWTILNNADGSAIPNMSQISFKIPLKKVDGTYLKSGIYPSYTRWQVKLKHLTITSHFVDYKVLISGEIYKPATIYKNEYDIKTQQLDQIIPKDLTRNILVQNKSESENGRGWKFNTANRLINTKGSKILLEDSGGNLQTYSAATAIETLYNANGTDIDLTYGAGLSTWPNIYVNSFGTDKIGRIKIIDGNNPTNISTQSQMEEISGTTGFDKTEDCAPGVTDPTIKLYKFNFKHKPGVSNFVEFPNGRVLGSNSTTHSVVDVTGAQSFAMGGNRLKAVDGNKFNLNSGGAGFSIRYQTLCSSMNLYCDPLVDMQQTQACSAALTAHDETGTLAHSQTSIPTTGAGGGNNFSGGTVNGSGYFGTANSSLVGFNNPAGMAISPDGKLVIADSGSNVVYMTNIETGSMKVLAGNYQALDTGDGGSAAPEVIYDLVKRFDKSDSIFVNLIKSIFGQHAIAAVTNSIQSYGGAAIYHPKGVAYDADGNLYITSESGYIRKVNPAGQISTYAGLSLADGGVLAENIHAQLINLRNPTGIAIDSVKKLMFVADTGNHRVLLIDMVSKIASVIAGSGQCDLNHNDGASSLSASLCSPTWVGLDNNKNLIILDSGHQRIRRVILNKDLSNKLTYVPSNGDPVTLEKSENGSFIQKFRNGNTNFYNSSGLQISAVDRVGRTTTFEYNLDKITSIIGTTGQTSRFYYSGDKMTSFVDPANRTTHFNYNGNDLVSVQYPDGELRSFQYDSDGRVIKDINQNAGAISFAYNSIGRLASVTDPEGKVTQVSDRVSETFEAPSVKV